VENPEDIEGRGGKALHFMKVVQNEVDLNYI
jgi:hypothetical protein